MAVRQNEPEDNLSATDLWEQIFARLAEAEEAAVVDPNHDSDEDDKRLRAGLAEAGWSKEEIDIRLKIHKEQHESAPITSPGVNPSVEFQFARLCDDIEAAMTRRGIDSQFRLARGIEPCTGPYASMTNVIMTRQGIVTVSSFMFRFCGLVARAFTRTLYLDPFFWESENYSKQDALNLMQQNHAIELYWFRIYLSFALTGTHILVPFKPARKHEVILFEQIARAMEIFAIGHEYGHHYLEHGRQVGADQKQEEFDADRFALEIGYEVEQKPVIFPNPYLLSGAGGVVILIALDTLREINKFISGGRALPSDTHPPTIERLSQFEQLSTSLPSDFHLSKGFRTASERIMMTVNACITDIVASVPRELIERMRVLLNRD